jgi:molybdate transport system substrate-binding protein
MMRMMLAAALAAGWSATAMGAEVKVLSAGAVEPGLHKAAALFKQKTGHDVNIQFNTAPQIARRMEEGYVADVLIAPPGGLDNYAKAGKVAAEGRVMIGRVGAGVAVRPDAPVPDIATVDALKKSLLEAESIVYNTASSGIYIETLFDRLGVGADLKARTKRYPTGEAVMSHVAKGTGKEIGFGPITEIKLFVAKGTLKFVGPLPAEVQNYTRYGAVLMANAPAPDAAKAFLAFLGTPEAKTAFVDAGID